MECARYEADEEELFTLHAVSGSMHAYRRQYACRFTPDQIRAFQLLHVFLHELGHHRDCVKRPNPARMVRGEGMRSSGR